MIKTITLYHCFRIKRKFQIFSNPSQHSPLAHVNINGSLFPYHQIGQHLKSLAIKCLHCGPSQSPAHETPYAHSCGADFTHSTCLRNFQPIGIKWQTHLAAFRRIPVSQSIFPAAIITTEKGKSVSAQRCDDQCELRIFCFNELFLHLSQPFSTAFPFLLLYIYIFA